MTSGSSPSAAEIAQRLDEMTGAYGDLSGNVDDLGYGD